MSDSEPLLGPLIPFGSKANCTLALCDVERSILRYQPSIPGNAVIIALFAISMFIHLFQGFLWHTWSFAISVAIGCIDEMIGYGGRIILHNNPFSFKGFMIQIVCITTAPVFICAAIYVTLSRTISHLNPSLSRFNPKLFAWFFIPCDIVSLVLQAAGGAMSATSSGPGGDEKKGQAGVNISLAGLGLQVFTLLLFIGLTADYLIRYSRSIGQRKMPTNTKIFLSFLGLSILFILTRCAYRIVELKDGYKGDMIHNEKEFMVLEPVMIVLAVFCLNVGQPGYGLRGQVEYSAASSDAEMQKNPAYTYSREMDPRLA